MTRKQGREYLIQQLQSIVPNDSIEMILEYICSFDPIEGNMNEMLTFLEDVCHQRKNLKEILHQYLSLCQQFDTKSPVFVPKLSSQEGNGSMNKKAINTLTLSTNSSSSLQGSNNQKKKNQPPSNSEAITFAETGKKHGKQNKKQHLNHSHSNKKSSTHSNSASRHLCGCFATHHEFYTSCLYCGRIHCNLEGPGECIYCGADLVPPLSADIACEVLNAANDVVVFSAYQQKDKLLTFDKEHAKRTQVHDAQGDYYETGTWLTQEEKDQIAEKEKKRLEKYQARGRQPTKVSFDLAGRKIYESTQEEIDCSCDNKDDDLHHISETTKLRNSIENMKNAATQQLAMDLSSLSLENVSLANAYSKHALLYRALREKLLSESDSHEPEMNESKNESMESRPNLLLGPIVATNMESIHQIKVQHALES